MQYGGLLSVRNRHVSILNSNPLRGPRHNLRVPFGMLRTALIDVATCTDLVYRTFLQPLLSLLIFGNTGWICSWNFDYRWDKEFYC